MKVKTYRLIVIIVVELSCHLIRVMFDNLSVLPHSKDPIDSM